MTIRDVAESTLGGVTAAHHHGGTADREVRGNEISDARTRTGNQKCSPIGPIAATPGHAVHLCTGLLRGTLIPLACGPHPSSTSLVAVCDVIRDAGTADTPTTFIGRPALDERDRLIERRPPGTGVTHRDVLEPDRHATEENELVRG